MKKGQSPWGNYEVETHDRTRSVVVFTPIAKGAGSIRSMPIPKLHAKDKASLWAAEDWEDYGAGKNVPRKRREFVDE